MPSAGTRAAILSDRGVHFSFPPLARLLVMTMLAKIGEDSCLLALLLEAPESTLEVLIVMDDDFRQTLCPSFRGGSERQSRETRELP